MPEEHFRTVDLVDPKGNRVTIQGDYDKHIWGPLFTRGAVLDYEYRHAGLGSHVLLAGCGLKEFATDGFSFTQALVQFLQAAFIDALSYTVLIQNIANLGPT
jgi:hypothetical protein